MLLVQHEMRRESRIWESRLWCWLHVQYVASSVNLGRWEQQEMCRDSNLSLPLARQRQVINPKQLGNQAQPIHRSDSLLR